MATKGEQRDSFPIIFHPTTNAVLFRFLFSYLKPQATAVMPTSECEVITGTSLSSPIIRGFSSSAICHEALRGKEENGKQKARH